MADDGSHSAVEITSKRLAEATEAAGLRTWQHLPAERATGEGEDICWSKTCAQCDFEMSGPKSNHEKMNVKWFFQK